MATEYLWDKITDLKNRFKSFFQHKKKISALENFSQAAPFPHRKYLGLIKMCVNDGFLGDKESEFLDHMLDTCRINYLDWAHKTPWLKKEIESRSKINPFDEHMLFDFEKKIDLPVAVPLHLVTTKTSAVRVRAS